MLGDNWFQWLKISAAIGCGLVAGVFFAFSTFVMAALARLHPAQGIAAMQSINITVINPLFMLAFMGTALLCLALGISSVIKWQQSGMMPVFAGSILYLAGTFLVTIICNVPLNDALAAADPASVQGEHVWKAYVAAWTQWNHVRTLAALAASAILTASLFMRG